MALIDMCRLFRKKQYLLNASHVLLKWEHTYLHSTGWLRSFKENKPVDRNGQDLPWMNYAVIHLLKERLTKNMNLFEYGSGSSTLFFSQLVGFVRSVEYDQSWFQKVTSEMPENVDLLFREKDENGLYCRTISESPELYDVVLVDGRDRVNCIKHSVKKLKDRGVIILDDSSREEYEQVFVFMRKNRFRNISLEGLKPAGWDIDRTTIFYREGNCLGI